MRSFFLAAMLALSLPLAGAFADLARAHHGWGWATDEEFQLTGTITGKRLGNPHGELTLQADEAEWLVEIGQPWRNERAGLTEDVLANGTEVTVHGHRSARQGERLMKAERLVIAGKEYDLYPGRTS
ncbi:DUF6152 family protein [Afifella pfennigii]|uniref:DUF6152 family protein n=1 Tax=Afifella pfennigii TaxID=209897 RepID=UPI0005590829|nr:DUF6152 family protein [Afifella pfennigii]